MTADDFAGLLHAKRVKRGQWVAKCPAHGDRKPSLSIAVGKKSPVVFKCMSVGCTADEILGAMGLTWRDVLGERKVDSSVMRKFRADESRQRALRWERTKLRWMASEKIEWWRRKANVLGRSLSKWPNDKLCRKFNHALEMQRTCEMVWREL